MPRPIDYGTDVVVLSSGSIVDVGTFNQGNGRFPLFTEPSEAYHGLVHWNAFGLRQGQKY